MSDPFAPLLNSFLLVVGDELLLKVKWLGEVDEILGLKWFFEGDGDVVGGFGDVGVAAGVLDVVKHLVLKLLPMQTTMTFELLLPFDCVDDDCVLVVL